MTIGVAFLGCTHPHIFPRIELLREQPDVELIGCYDPDPALVVALERDWGLKAYELPEVLLDAPGLKFVIIEGWIRPTLAMWRRRRSAAKPFCWRSRAHRIWPGCSRWSTPFAPTLCRSRSAICSATTAASPTPNASSAKACLAR